MEVDARREGEIFVKMRPDFMANVIAEMEQAICSLSTRPVSWLQCAKPACRYRRQRSACQAHRRPPRKFSCAELRTTQKIPYVTRAREEVGVVSHRCPMIGRGGEAHDKHDNEGHARREWRSSIDGTRHLHVFDRGACGWAEAKGLLKAMSDYLAAQKAISFAYDSDLEVVTKDRQKLLLASSGKVDLGRPDKIRATRTGGFADVEMSFDGKTVTLLGKNANLYTQTEAPGTIEKLIDTLRDKLGRPLPAADLLLPNVYDELMRDVTDVKDLGSG